MAVKRSDIYELIASGLEAKLRAVEDPEHRADIQRAILRFRRKCRDDLPSDIARREIAAPDWRVWLAAAPVRAMQAMSVLLVELSRLVETCAEESRERMRSEADLAFVGGRHFTRKPFRYGLLRLGW